LNRTCSLLIRQGQEILGEVTQKASAFTGLLPGTPVMTGTVDGSAAALEAGVVEEGIVAEMTGTSTVLLMPDTSGIIEPAFIAMQHAIPGLHLLLGALASTGACLKWFRDNLGETELKLSKKKNISAYELLIRQAIVSKPGSGGVLFLPYMMGERSPIWHTNARGVFFGLSLSTSRGNMVRAILEGTSFALLHNIEIAKRSGITISEIRSIGGGTQSEVWNQIKADVLGIPVLIPETSIGAPFGDAILVGMGLGYYKNPQKSLKKMVKMKDRFTPNPQNHELYKGYFKLYKSIYRNLVHEFDSMAALENR
jgi:xylulokinase